MAATNKLPSVGQFLRHTWQVFKARWKTLLAIYVLPLLLSIIPLVLGLGTGFFWIRNPNLRNTFPLPVLLAVFIPLFFTWLLISFWSGIAIILAIRDWQKQTSWKECYRQAWPKIGKYFIVGLLFMFVYMGAALCLLLPAIIWLVWLSMSFFVVVVEDKGGFSALKRSKYLVSGFWWQVVGRWLILVLLFIPLAIVLGIFEALFKKLHLLVLGTLFRTGFNLFLQFFLVMFLLIYSYYIYENLNKIKGEGEVKSWGVKLFAILGGLVFLLSIVAMGISIAINPAGQMQKAKDTKAKLELQQIAEALEMYRADNLSYPVTLEELKPDYLPLSNKVTSKPSYQLFGDDYRLCVYLEGEKTNYCLPEDADASLKNLKEIKQMPPPQIPMPKGDKPL